MTPVDTKLYNTIREEAKKKFRRWPSAYASGWLVAEYKRRGGTYSGRKKPTSLARWYKEKWIDVCTLPKVVPCGRTHDTGDKDYPYCRPLVRVNKDTPKTVDEFTPQQLRDRCRRKRLDPKKRLV